MEAGILLWRGETKSSVDSTEVGTVGTACLQAPNPRTQGTCYTDGHRQEPLTKQSSKILRYLWQRGLLLMLALQQIIKPPNPASTSTAIFITSFSSIRLHSSFLPRQDLIRTCMLCGWKSSTARDPVNFTYTRYYSLP